MQPGTPWRGQESASNHHSPAANEEVDLRGSKSHKCLSASSFLLSTGPFEELLPVPSCHRPAHGLHHHAQGLTVAGLHEECGRIFGVLSCLQKTRDWMRLPSPSCCSRASSLALLISCSASFCKALPCEPEGQSTSSAEHVRGTEWQHNGKGGSRSRHVVESRHELWQGRQQAGN